MNETIANIGNLEVNGLEVIQNMTKVLWIKSNKSYNPSQIRLAKSYNLTVPKTDLSLGLGIKLVYKLTKSLRETNNKIHKSKIYNEAIDNLIHGNKWRKVIDKKLWNLASYQA